MLHIASDEPQSKVGPNTRLLSYLPPPPEHKFLGLLPFWKKIIKTHLQAKSAVFRSEKGRRRKIHRMSSGGSFTLKFLPTSTLNGLWELEVVGSIWDAKHRQVQLVFYQEYHQTVIGGECVQCALYIPTEDWWLQPVWHVLMSSEGSFTLMFLATSTSRSKWPESNPCSSWSFPQNSWFFRLQCSCKIQVRCQVLLGAP